MLLFLFNEVESLKFYGIIFLSRIKEFLAMRFLFFWAEKKQKINLGFYVKYIFIRVVKKSSWEFTVLTFLLFQSISLESFKPISYLLRVVQIWPKFSHQNKSVESNCLGIFVISRKKELTKSISMHFKFFFFFAVSNAAMRP